jgi:protoporphyrinogen oxidase
MLTDMSRKWLVAGGGISGLAAAQCLQANDRDYLLLERCPALGGLTRTTQVEDFCFDYTGHFLHLRRFGSPSKIPYAHLNDEDWETVERKSYFFGGGRLITAPIQYHLGELPDDLRNECEDSYDARPKAEGDIAGFREFITSGFGQAIADRFLIPQNEKTMATPLGRLSIGAVKRFFPPPDEQRIRAGFANENVNVAEYNTTFWYPKRGGIDVLTRGLARGLKSAAMNEEIIGIDLDRRTVSTSAGRRIEWEKMLPSIPLKTLCKLTGDVELGAAAQKLSHSSTISFNFGIRGKLPSELKDAHWIYVPDREIPFYRFGCYSNISPAMCSNGYSAVYVEVGVPGEDIDRVDIASKLQAEVIAALEKLRWVRSEDIVCAVTHVIRCAYVHHTPERDQLVEVILERLNASGIHPIGRYGLWDYVGMEDSISSALTTVESLL